MADATPQTQAADRIGANYYDTSGYFEEGADHLLDPHSRFQRYRVSEVLRIYTPAKDARVMDLGCGWGTFTAALTPRVGKLIAADFSLRSLELTRLRMDAEGLASRAQLLCADATSIPLGDASLDVVLAADLVEHLYPDQTVAMVEECARILHPGGKLIVWTPNPGHIFERLRVLGVLRADPSHVDYKTLGRMTGLLEAAGFEIERSEYRPSHLPGFRWAERVLQRTIPPMRRRIAILANRL